MSELKFKWSEPPAPGEVKQILPGFDWIRHPMPFALDHVNCWYLHNESNSGADNETCLIDTGVYDMPTRELWNGLATQFGWNAGSDGDGNANHWPDKLLLTHFHPDHSGLAGWFAERGSTVVSTEIEWGMITMLNAIEDDTYRSVYEQWYTANGIEQSYIDALKHIGNGYRSKAAAAPESCEFISATDTLNLAGRSYKVLTGQGHSPDMIMLHNADDNLLVVADQVLPSITPNVSWMPNLADQNPLSSFLQCITSLKELPEETLVLPSHGLPFVGLHQRIDFLLDHHQQRLQEIESALRTEHTAAELFPLLFKRKLDHQQLSFALGETLAHLKYMESLSQVRCETRNGVNHYQVIS